MQKDVYAVAPLEAAAPGQTTEKTGKICIFYIHVQLQMTETVGKMHVLKYLLPLVAVLLVLFHVNIFI